MNRLKLDFTIPDIYGRKRFVEDYLEENFPEGKLTEKELETIANYMLYGKDIDGENVVDRGEIEIETRYSTWSKKPVESLDGLLESPTFSENQIQGPNQPHYRTPKVVFSREENSHITELHDLWKQIDALELVLNFYDLAHNKRKKDPRKDLLDRFTPEQIENAKQKAASLKLYSYYKMRHLLVELRREQYTIRDSYVTEITPKTPYRAPVFLNDHIPFEDTVPVLPLGLFNDTPMAQRIFSKVTNDSFNEDSVKQISSFYYEQKSHTGAATLLDFTNLEHIYNLFLYCFELEEDSLDDPETTTPFVLKTLNFYVEMAELDEVQIQILNLKKRRVKNQDIADSINKQFNKTYTSNYISTIFRQKICMRVAEAAQYHALLIENLAFPENFKNCNTCGVLLLRDTHNFVRKARASDGYSNRCKKCDKAERQSKKLKEN